MYEKQSDKTLTDGAMRLFFRRRGGTDGAATVVESSTTGRRQASEPSVFEVS